MKKRVVRLSEGKLAELIENVIVESDASTSAMRKIIYFGFNYPHDFVEKVWADEPNMANHLKSKFLGAYDKYGSKGAFPNFFVQLDNENQDKLCSWISANYKG